MCANNAAICIKQGGEKLANYKIDFLRTRVTKEEKALAQKVADHHKMSVEELIRVLIKREALKVL